MSADLERAARALADEVTYTLAMLREGVTGCAWDTQAALLTRRRDELHAALADEHRREGPVGVFSTPLWVVNRNGGPSFYDPSDHHDWSAVEREAKIIDATGWVAVRRADLERLAAPPPPATGDVTRVVLVDHTTEMLGRVYDKSGVSVTTSVQDDGRTLKVFVDNPRRPACDERSEA